MRDSYSGRCGVSRGAKRILRVASSAAAGAASVSLTDLSKSVEEGVDLRRILSQAINLLVSHGKGAVEITRNDNAQEAWVVFERRKS